jgi:pimeloyl-ACP methyl ester carboxylesterase
MPWRAAVHRGYVVNSGRGITDIADYCPTDACGAACAGSARPWRHQGVVPADGRGARRSVSRHRRRPARVRRLRQADRRCLRRSILRRCRHRSARRARTGPCARDRQQPRRTDRAGDRPASPRPRRPSRTPGSVSGLATRPAMGSTAPSHAAGARARAAGRAAFYAAARQVYLEEPHGTEGFWPRLQTLQPDALFVWGRRDRLVPIAFARHVADALPRARHLQLDCGQVPQVERPKQTHAALAAFLSDTPHPGTRATPSQSR